MPSASTVDSSAHHAVTLGDAEQEHTLRTLEEVDREYILETLRDTHGVVGGLQGAAARLGVKRTTLLYKMEKLGISRQSW
jgi:formate hydrogenlyase transcriptional activator